MDSLGEQFLRAYGVQANGVEDFLNRYYKPDRFRSRGADYAVALIASHAKHYHDYGYDFISHHDSVTGEIVAWAEEVYRG